MNIKKNCQYQFRKKNFRFHKYWIIYYTEQYPNSSEIDYATFIKAKSYQLAKTILKSKIKEEDPKIKLKAIQGFMLHKTYKNYRNLKKLSIDDWGYVRDSAFSKHKQFFI